MSDPAPEPTDARTAARTGVLPLALATLVAFACLVGLGVWQLQRLAWKEALLARIDARIHAAAVDLPPAAQWPALANDDNDYLRLRVTGRFDHAREVYLFRPIGAGLNEPGYEVLTPLMLADGTSVIVNRGFVPERLKPRETRRSGLVEGETTVTGLLRLPEPRTAFTPTDRPDQNLWYTRDPAGMATHMGLRAAAPFVIDADAGAKTVWPHGGATVVAIKNDHLSYALTWFGLAAALLVVAGLFARKRLHDR